MLEISSVMVESKLDVDFVEIFEKSVLYREGENAIIEEPITFAEMNKRKMSKDLEVAKLKKLAKEKLLQDQDKLR
ncbi:hypothetical protein AgCh_013016 [Apium graveolens]